MVGYSFCRGFTGAGTSDVVIASSGSSDEDELSSDRSPQLILPLGPFG